MRLSNWARAFFLSAATERRHGPGTTLINEEDRDGCVFLLLEGSARVLMHTANGKLVTYDELGPGDLVGVLAAIDGKLRSASVEACSAGRTALVSAGAFKTMMEDHTFAQEVHVHLVAKIRELSDRVFDFSTLLVRERLVRELLRRMEGLPGCDGPLRLRPAPTHFTLATRIATHREAVSREMSRLTQLGLLKRDGPDLIALSRRALARVLEDEAS